jgi:8-oxo-dGTP pyrophosphatase MutT (NUDIX family)
MKIFIKDIPVNIISSEDLINPSQYDQIIRRSNSAIDIGGMAHVVLIEKPSIEQFDNILMYLKQNGLKDLEEITFLVDNYKDVVKHVKSEYTIIEAAGGLVFKGGRALIINRLKRWDLPKGKLNRKEKPKAGALREVKEECNIEVKLGKKICNTWHTYKRNGEKILKKTHWFTMYCTDDSKMRPQIEENIEDLKWMGEEELKQAFYNTYSSIRYVFKQYYKMF